MPRTLIAKLKVLEQHYCLHLKKMESGKLIYLYTDNACTYQFYEHRGFERSEERQVVLDLDKGKSL